MKYLNPTFTDLPFSPFQFTAIVSFSLPFLLSFPLHLHPSSPPCFPSPSLYSLISSPLFPSFPSSSLLTLSPFLAAVSFYFLSLFSPLPSHLSLFPPFCSSSLLLPFLSPSTSLFQLSDDRSFQVRCRFDTDVELTYFKHGGILNYMIRKMSADTH